MLDINASALSASTFTFLPVCVARGRMFKGFAYFISAERYGVAYAPVSYERATLWDPASKQFVHANAEFCNDATVSDDELAVAKLDYVKSLVDSTYVWCKSVKPDISEDELDRFALNVIRKQRPWLLEFISKTSADTRDVAELVRSTLAWASTLKTRPCYMYGRFMPGGKPYSPARQVAVAYKALVKNGATALDGFEAAWQMHLDVLGLPVPKAN